MSKLHLLDFVVDLLFLFASYLIPTTAKGLQQIHNKSEAIQHTETSARQTPDVGGKGQLTVKQDTVQTIGFSVTFWHWTNLQQVHKSRTYNKFCNKLYNIYNKIE